MRSRRSRCGKAITNHHIRTVEMTTIDDKVTGLQERKKNGIMIKCFDKKDIAKNLVIMGETKFLMLRSLVFFCFFDG